MKGNTVLVGADPELFIVNPNNGCFISAHGRVPGTKWEPHPVPHGAVQIDGTALEFNIDPASTVDEFVFNINSVRRTLTQMVGDAYNVVAEPVARYEPGYFKDFIPDEAKALGCNPDYNGWTKDTNPQPDPEGEPFRTASGHLHIGWTTDADPMDKDHFLYCCKVARHLDYYLGMNSLLWDPDPTRRQLYGKAGAFRPKSYGLEYRVLSNRWLDNEAIMRWVYNTLQVAMADAFAENWAEDRWGDVAQRVINDNIIGWKDVYQGIDLGLEELPLNG